MQQYARDFKADIDALSKVKVSVGATATKLTEADALTSDLLQHYYQTCTLYNACIIAPQDYAVKTEKLQAIQLEVRRALVGGGLAAQQNIQINPPFGPQPFPPGAQGVPPGGFPPPGFPQQPGPVPGDPGLQQGPTAFPPQFPGQQFPRGAEAQPGVQVTIPPSQAAQTADTILNVLREGSQLFRSATPLTSQPGAGAQAPPSGTPAPFAPPQDLDSSLRAMLVSLKQGIAQNDPARASGRAVVGNFTEEGQPFSSPLGALLKDRTASLVETEGLFKPPSGPTTRGITVKEVATVQNPNDPKALSTLYNTDLAIAGTYRSQGDRINLRLQAIDDKGTELAQTASEIPAQAVPNVVAPQPANAADTNQFLNSLNQLGPKSQGTARVEVTTNRPGEGANFRLGEEIKYFVTSTMEGYLYLFHMDAEKNLLRLFPNQYQREARVSTGQAIEFPPPGAPFKFEASPPFGLETTVAMVTGSPLDEKDFQMIEGGFAKPKQGVATIVATRGISVKGATPGPSSASPPASSASQPRLVWNTVTVLIRP